MIAFECSGCGNTIRFPDDTPGVKVKCTRCGAKTYTPLTFPASDSAHLPSRSGHIPRSGDSDVHCLHCNTAIGSNDLRCKACGSLNASGQAARRVGVLIFSAVGGCIATAVFLQVLFMSWPTWEKGIKKYGPGPDVPPSDAGIIAGAVVFLIGTVFMAVMIHRDHK